MPLSSVKILDFTFNLPGPYCSLILADLGADVLKVENPASGDSARGFMHAGTGDSPYFLAINRSKRSLALNLKDPDARRVIERLTAQGYDVWLEGFRPGVMGRMGLDYQTMSQRFPSLIQASISGYGQDSPRVAAAGHDAGYMARAGMLYPSGPPGGPPVLPTIQIADLAGGALPAAVGVLAAIIQRQATGQGRLVDVSMVDCLFSLGHFVLAGAAAGKEEARPQGLGLTGLHPCYHIYQTSDGRHVVLASLERHFWLAFVEAIARPGLRDRQFDPSAVDEVAQVIAAQDFAHWSIFSERVDCCLDPVLTPAEAEASDQAKAHHLVWELDDPARGTLRQGPPLLRNLAERPHSPPPGLGQHTREVLSQAGFDDSEIERMAARGAVRLGDA